jgi:hypothetical protein
MPVVTRSQYKKKMNIETSSVQSNRNAKGHPFVGGLTIPKKRKITMSCGDVYDVYFKNEYSINNII